MFFGPDYTQVAKRRFRPMPTYAESVTPLLHLGQQV